MKFCSNCQKTIDTQGNFCVDCGTPLTDVVLNVEQVPVEPQAEQYPAPEQYAQPSPYVQPEVEQPYAAQPTDTQYAPYDPYNQYNQSVYYQGYQQPQLPSKGKVITGMALSIAGFAFAMLGTLYTLIPMAYDGEASFAFALVFAFFSLPLSIVGLVMSSKNRSQGDTSVMSKLGKTFGLIGVIATGVMILLGIVGLSVGGVQDYYDDYYYY